MGLKYKSLIVSFVNNLPTQFKATKRSIRDHLFWLATLLIMTLVLSAAGAPILVSLVAWTGLSNISPNSEGFLSAIVQAIATILAIQFSVSILAVQHASSNYSPSILERYGRNPKVIYAYVFEAAALVFSTLALFGARSQAFFLVSFVMFLSTLVYLFAHFSLTLALVNPKSVIFDLQHEAISKVRSSCKNILSVRMSKPRRLLFPITGHIRHPLIMLDTAILDASRNTIISSFNILQKSIARRDYETSVAGFQSVVSISQTYVEVTGRVIRPDDVFITFLLEQLHSVSKVAFDNPDVMILIEDVRAIRHVGYSSLNIAGFKGTSNLSSKLSVYYLRELGMRALVAGLNDVAAEISGAIGYLGSKGLEVLHDDLLSPEALASIGNLSSNAGQWFVTQRVLLGLQMIISAGISARQPWQELAGAFESLAKIVSSSVAGGRGNPVIYSVVGWLPDTGLEKLAKEGLAVKQGTFPKIETAGREAYAREVFQIIIDTLEQIGNAGAKKRDGLVVLSVSEALHSLGVLMIEEKFVNPKGFSDEIGNLLETLTAIYPRDENSLAESFIPDALAHLASKLLDNSNDTLATQAVEEIQQLAIAAVRTDDEYTSQRVAEKLVIIGGYAQKLGKDALADKSVALLLEYDRKYMETTKNPQDMMYFEELEESNQETFREKRISVNLDAGSLLSFKERYLAQKKPAPTRRSGKSSGS